ncbi:hypothetical protein KV697_08495 [Sphingomonas sanguinis]|uniref:hypothetical protein n=1 Tax=Sphingomonas sanguinis TaxID=33051 RepID=UPI001C59DDE0|nr:hypothetical protein [Sphingomonas sanguinis]QXT37298.1 hypothetical protein KV697_08495 [Sphingomonas sanguinis]
MASNHVVFKIDRGEGLDFVSIKINDTLLDFDNDQAGKSLKVGTPFEIYWRIQGRPGAKLTIKYTVDGIERIAVETAIPTNRSRFTDFMFLTL